jgi:hypothetical protein
MPPGCSGAAGFIESAYKDLITIAFIYQRRAGAFGHGKGNGTICSRLDISKIYSVL